MSGIFQKMLSDEYKTAFVQKLENKLGMPDEIRDSIMNYIKSSELDNDIKKLCVGDRFFAS